MIYQDQYSDVRQRPARFEIEAEAFTSRNNGSAQGNWVKVASKTNLIQAGEQEGEAAVTTPGDARQGTYLLAVGKSTVGAPGSDEYDGPTVDYKVNVITPGIYTIRLGCREQGTAVDSLVLQTKDLPSPGNPRDSTRVKPGMWGMIKRVESVQARD